MARENVAAAGAAGASLSPCATSHVYVRDWSIQLKVYSARSPITHVHRRKIVCGEYN